MPPEVTVSPPTHPGSIPYSVWVCLRMCTCGGIDWEGSFISSQLIVPSDWLNNKNLYWGLYTKNKQLETILSSINLKGHGAWQRFKHYLLIWYSLTKKDKQNHTKTPSHTGAQLILQAWFMCFITLAVQERPLVTSPLQCPSYSSLAYSSSLILSIVSMLGLVGECHLPLE